ncbi:hypothetical protein [Ensifer adhaerens]|uniref:Uncharacterized protein n=1 Tax=Ensifer adhaerens TaxID=106592 RepID=A0A9Q8YFY5_ENSAD|nr:hypothetical protein [Ensifer adhaerens]USJ27410.1 hypothetical protein NE863_33730 [Ensifer adhaerens]
MAEEQVKTIAIGPELGKQALGFLRAHAVGFDEVGDLVGVCGSRGTSLVSFGSQQIASA